MFTIRFATLVHPPDESVVLMTEWTEWAVPEAGYFENGAWTFVIDEADGDRPFAFKFVLESVTWMDGVDLVVDPAPGAVFTFDDQAVTFSPVPGVVTEDGRVQRLMFVPDYDEQHVYDVIVVGSGMGGGLLADQLSDAGADVLVLEVGSYLFPTHVANLPRRLPVGRFDKNVWGLWQDFKVVNYANTPGSLFAGAQGFNLGGRTVFWGGLIPRMGAWELASWPEPVRDYLGTVGYRLAEDALNRSGPMGSPYQELARQKLTELMPEFVQLDAPVAVQYQGYTPLSIPGGMFSTADLLAENRMVDDPGRPKPKINLNHAVQKLTVQGNRVTGVECFDLLSRQQRVYHANTVVLAAGTIESAKIALQSQLNDPANLIGKGITDHPIWFTHFSLPPGSPWASTTASAKLWSRHNTATVDTHPYNVVVELGADFNQGRYVDPDNLARHRELKGDSTLCEIVFLFNANLVAGNSVTIGGPPHLPVNITMQPAQIPGAIQQEVRDIAQNVLQGLGAEALQGENLDLAVAGLGGVAHEVGTLRMGAGVDCVVDPDLKFLAYENLYACDNSVFASSPAANPTLTLAALSLRLAKKLTA